MADSNDPPDATPRAMDQRGIAMAVSLGVSVLMLVGKVTAYFITGSTAILSDAAESVVHILATAFAGYSLWYTLQPPDTGHPYGHGKIAYFSAGFEGALISFAALTILYSAGRSLAEGPELEQLDLGLIITGGLAVVNLMLGLFLIRVGRQRNSLVLVSNGKHVLTDMWTSVGVVIGIALVYGTRLLWLDPVVAILVALNILWTAVKLIRQAVDGLMERADGTVTESLLSVLQGAEGNGVISGFHQLRHRRVNDQMWVEYHLQFPAGMTITEAHERAHDVEEAIMALYPRDSVNVTAHLEPEEHSEAHPHGFAEPKDPLQSGQARTA